MSDARERRRERAEASKQQVDVKAMLRKFMVPIIIVLISGAIIGYNVAASQGVFGEDEGCPGHWHAGYSVWDGDTKVDFSERTAAGNAQASPGAGFHIHGNDGTLHFHPAAERCIALGDALEKMDVMVTSETLTVRGETREADADHEVVVYHQPWGGDWRQITNLGKFFDDQIGDGDRLVIAFTAKNSTLTIEDRQMATTDLTGGNYEPTTTSGMDDEVFVRITVTAIFGVLAILIWYNLAKKTW